MQYLVVDANGTLFEYAGGWACLSSHRPMALETTMMAYSMSKTITAAAVLQLVEARKIALDDPIDRHVESPYGPQVTVRHLLSHTSGIPNPIPLRWVHAVQDHADFREDVALAAVLQKHRRLAASPGTRYAYSNIGYWILGPIVERVSGESFIDYVRNHVLGPSGIKPEALAYAVVNPATHATGYLEKFSLVNLIKRFVIDAALIGEYEGPWLRIARITPTDRHLVDSWAPRAQSPRSFRISCARVHVCLTFRPVSCSMSHNRLKGHGDRHDPRLAHRRGGRRPFLLQGRRRRRVSLHDANLSRSRRWHRDHD